MVSDVLFHPLEVAPGGIFFGRPELGHFVLAFLVVPLMSARQVWADSTIYNTDTPDADSRAGFDLYFDSLVNPPTACGRPANCACLATARRSYFIGMSWRR